MAKGQAQAAGNQLATTNAIGQQQQQQAGQLEAGLIPSYENMLTEGYTPAQQSAMTTGALGSTAASYGAAGQDAVNSAARTNNASNLTAQQDQQALDKGVGMGQETAGLQQQFANRQQQNQQLGLEGLSQLYGTNQQAANSMYGLGPGTLQARAAGQNTGLAIAGDVLGAAGSAAA
jgi:hypothetical protein